VVVDVKRREQRDVAYTIRNEHDFSPWIKNSYLLDGVPQISRNFTVVVKEKCQPVIHMPGKMARPASQLISRIKYLAAALMDLLTACCNRTTVPFNLRYWRICFFAWP
jgi:hypothetical protein